MRVSPPKTGAMLTAKTPKRGKVLSFKQVCPQSLHTGGQRLLFCVAHLAIPKSDPGQGNAGTRASPYAISDNRSRRKQCRCRRSICARRGHRCFDAVRVW